MTSKDMHPNPSGRAARWAGFAFPAIPHFDLPLLLFELAMDLRLLAKGLDAIRLNPGTGTAL